MPVLYLLYLATDLHDARDGATAYGPVRDGMIAAVMAVAERQQSGAVSFFDDAGARVGSADLKAGPGNALAIGNIRIGQRPPSASSEAAVRDLADLATRAPAYLTFRAGEQEDARPSVGALGQLVGDAARIVDERERRIALRAEAEAFGGVRFIDEGMELSKRYPPLAAVQTVASTNRTGVLSFFDAAGVEIGSIAVRRQEERREALVVDAVADAGSAPKEGLAAIHRIERSNASRAIFEEGRVSQQETVQQTVMGVVQSLHQQTSTTAPLTQGPQPGGTWPDDVFA